MDKLVLDIETKNSFDDVGGRHNLDKLEISTVGIYSYNRDEYFCVGENDLHELPDIFYKSGLVVGFALKRFDFPVLNKYLPFDIMKMKYLDMLEEIERIWGRRIGLGILAEHNLGYGKSGDGLQAIQLYKEGKIDELNAYCLQDVKVTKELYEFARDKSYLEIPHRYGGQPERVELDWTEEVLPQATLF